MDAFGIFPAKKEESLNDSLLLLFGKSFRQPLPYRTLKVAVTILDSPKICPVAFCAE